MSVGGANSLDPDTPPGLSDLQGEPAADVLRRAAEEMEALVDTPSTPDRFLAEVLTALRAELNCRYHLLASEWNWDGEPRQWVIHANVEGGSAGDVSRLGIDLASLFENTLSTADGTFGRDLTSDTELPFVSAAKRVEIEAVGGETDSLVLLLAVFDPVTPRDPEFPRVAFLTHDQYRLRVALYQIATFLRHEHEARRRASEGFWDQRRGGPSAAERLMEFRRYLGLDADRRAPVPDSSGRQSWVPVGGPTILIVEDQPPALFLDWLLL